MKPLTEKHQNKLFDHLWPAMEYVKEHKATCIKEIKAINNYFLKYKDDHDLLLKSLCSIEGIGLTIASGLIWAYYPTNRVPFDKYTLTFAIERKIIPNEQISQHYVAYSERIKSFCKRYVIGERSYTIEDFVREAMVKVQNFEFECSPR